MGKADNTKSWKIVRDPIYPKDYHRFHEHRYIMTEDARIDMSTYVENDWCLDRGNIICSLRDLPDIENVASLIVTAPKMVKALAIAYSFIDQKVKDNLGVHISGQNGNIENKETIMKLIEEVLVKAKIIKK